MISELHLTEWYRLCEEATPGPWSFDKDDERRRIMTWHDAFYGENILDGMVNGDAAFIAAAREAMPMLLDEVRKLEAENRSLKERLRVLEENCLFYPDEIVRRACGVSNV